MKTGAQVMTNPRGESGRRWGWMAAVAVTMLVGSNGCRCGRPNTGEDAGSVALKAPVVEALPST